MVSGRSFISSKQVSTIDSNCLVEVESVLRLRPLSRKERDDCVVLEPLPKTGRGGPATALLNPIHLSLASPIAGGSSRMRADSDGTGAGAPAEYHFNHVLGDTTSQDKIYYTLGLPIATSSMESLKKATGGQKIAPKSHLLVCMGISNSGKTFTCFGGTAIPKRRASQDGLVPRLVDSLFSQSKHHASGGSKSFAVEITAVQVAEAKGKDFTTVQDLLGAPAPKTKSKVSSTPKRSVLSMARNFERAVLPSPIRSSPAKSTTEILELDVEDLRPTVRSCKDVTQAREILQSGLSASLKSLKGNVGHHLMITIQPVYNGVHYGDKIAILDMAGLEKKRTKNRGKDSFVNEGQTANAAVLHCLRTLIHNTRIQTGKSNSMELICPDDEASDISCVSQTKPPYSERTKPVPFRQHKLTMLLNPIFNYCASTKVTMILSAYPGHGDYQEKKALLQDFELLCGSSLMPASVPVKTGTSRSDDAPSIGRSFSTDDDESVISRASSRLRKTNSSLLGPRKSTESTDSLTLSVSSGDEDEGKIPMPPAYAPRSSAGFQAKAPSPLSALDSVSKQPSVNPGYVASKSTDMKHFMPIDFPGVAMPLPSPKTTDQAKKQKEESESKVQVTAEAPRVSTPTTTTAPLEPSKILTGNSTIPVAKQVKEVASKHVVTAPFAPNVRSPRPPVVPQDPNVKTPLGPSTSYNQKTLDSIPKEYVGKSIHSEEKLLQPPKETTFMPHHSQAAPSLKHSIQKISSTRSNDDTSGTTKEKLEEARRVEVQLKRVVDEKQALERKVELLEKENRKLKEIAREASRSNPDVEWTEEDEKEFLESRKDRLDAQTLVQEPILQHLEQVNYIYDIKNQWCQSDKPQFDLSFPMVFQRAEELNIRDKHKEEKEEAKKKLLLLKEEKKSKANVPASASAKSPKKLPTQRQRVVEPITTKGKDNNSAKQPNFQEQKENNMNRSSLAKLKRLATGKSKF